MHRDLLAVPVFVLTLCVPTASIPDSSAKPGCKSLPADMTLDQAWGGTRVQFSALETPTSIYVAYYDRDRWLAVSKVTKCTGQVEKVRLPSQFGGWDAHNYVALALDNGGRLHVAGNMHATPLVYSRMTSPEKLDSLSQLRPMVGNGEDKTTYPVFFKFPDGALGFSYRLGHAGMGDEVINRFEGEKWSRWLDRPLFASVSKTDTVNAYHTGYATGPDGFFHLAWVWRKDMVETNFNINYVKSRDLKAWSDSGGRSIALPITPANAEVVDPVPIRSGLLNNIKIGFDAQGRPVISYLKFDGTGFSQLFHARREADGWKRYQSTDWTYRWDPRGAGTIAAEISMGGVALRDGQLLERVVHPKLGSVTLRYDPANLKVMEVFKGYDWDKAPKLKRTPSGGANVAGQPVTGADGKPTPGRAISWLSFPAGNRDQKRECPKESPDCSFAFDLQLNSAAVP